MHQSWIIGIVATIIVALSGTVAGAIRAYGNAKEANAVQAVALQSAEQEAERAKADKIAADKLIAELTRENAEYESRVNNLASKTRKRRVVYVENPKCGSTLVPVNRDPFIVQH